MVKNDVKKKSAEQYVREGVRDSPPSLMANSQERPQPPSVITKKPPDRNETFSSVKRFLTRRVQEHDQCTTSQGSPNLPSTFPSQTNPSQKRLKVKSTQSAPKCPRQPLITLFCNHPPIKSLSESPQGLPTGQVPPWNPGEKLL